jgi:hypothetical protein
VRPFPQKTVAYNAAHGLTGGLLSQVTMLAKRFDGGPVDAYCGSEIISARSAYSWPTW